MEVLQFVKVLLKINSTLTIFDSTLLGNLFESIKFGFILSGPTIYFLSISVYIILNLDDSTVVISRMYNICACTFSGLMHISLRRQSKDIQSLLNRTQSLVNESK